MKTLKQGSQYIIKSNGEDKVHNIKYGTVVTIEEDTPIKRSFVAVKGVRHQGEAKLIGQDVPPSELCDIKTGEGVIPIQYEVGEIVRLIGGNPKFRGYLAEIKHDDGDEYVSLNLVDRTAVYTKDAIETTTLKFRY
jgi:hypothetical protein